MMAMNRLWPHKFTNFSIEKQKEVVLKMKLKKTNN